MVGFAMVKGCVCKEFETLFDLLLYLPFGEEFRGPFHHVLRLVCIRVFMFGEDVDDTTRGVAGVIGFEVDGVDECRGDGAAG
jgi:hypothetical protein